MRCFLVVVLLFGAAFPAAAQHGLGPRQQWQPQRTEDGFDPDRRLPP
jgi:hypothetical protein